MGQLIIQHFETEQIFIKETILVFELVKNKISL